MFCVEDNCWSAALRLSEVRRVFFSFTKRSAGWLCDLDQVARV